MNDIEQLAIIKFAADKLDAFMLGHFCGHIIKGHTLSSTLDQVGEYIRQKQDDSISAALFMEIGVNWAVFRSKVLSWDFSGLRLIKNSKPPLLMPMAGSMLT
jgi:hypothetical protein